MFHRLKGNKFQGFVYGYFVAQALLLGKLDTFCPPENPLCLVLRLFLFLLFFIFILCYWLSLGNMSLSRSVPAEGKRTRTIALDQLGFNSCNKKGLLSLGRKEQICNFFFFNLRQGLTWLRLASSSLYSWGTPWSPDLPATSQVVHLQKPTTMPSFLSVFYCRKDNGFRSLSEWSKNRHLPGLSFGNWLVSSC